MAVVSMGTSVAGAIVAEVCAEKFSLCYHGFSCLHTHYSTHTRGVGGNIT